MGAQRACLAARRQVPPRRMHLLTLDRRARLPACPGIALQPRSAATRWRRGRWYQTRAWTSYPHA